ncbi:MAG: hypothetical protein ABI867_02655 [Kofleriaceae bacterium]
MRCAVFLFVMVAGCTRPNPQSCLDGLCTDPAFPFCDFDGTVEGAMNTCIAVDCTPGEFVACRGKDRLTCNTTGNDLDITECQDVCDESVGGCRVTEVREPFIVYSSNRDGNVEIYRMKEDGTLPTNLTLNAANDSFPLWDPTGDHIAFLSDRNGPVELFVMDPDGSNVMNVSVGQADEPAWSPDGSRLSFASARAGSLELYTVQRDGTMLHPLSTTGLVGTASWSPDGMRLVFTSGSQLFVVDADGNGATPITTGNDTGPRWSPNGLKIAFSHRLSFDNREIFISNPDGTGPVNITNSATESENDSPVWSPDGAFLVGTGGVDPDTEIYVVDAAGVRRDNVSNSAGSRDARPCWSPDGQRIAFSSERGGDNDIYVTARTGGTATNLTMSAGSDLGCSWRPK